MKELSEKRPNPLGWYGVAHGDDHGVAHAHEKTSRNTHGAVHGATHGATRESTHDEGINAETVEAEWLYTKCAMEEFIEKRQNMVVSV